MTEEFTRLRNLRISVARVAQAAGVSLAPIGVPDNAPYEVLHRKAEEMHPGCGWNTLCAAVIGKLEEAKPVQKYEFWSECPFTIGFDFEMRAFLSRTSRGGRP